MSDSILEMAEQMIPAWDILNKFFCPAFILTTLGIFPSRFPRRFQKWLLPLFIFVSGGSAQLLIILTTQMRKGFPYLHPYCQVSILAVLMFSLFAILFYQGNGIQIILISLLLYNLFSSFRFLFLCVGLMIYPSSFTDALWVIAELFTCLVCAVISWGILHYQKNTESSLSWKENAVFCAISFMELIFTCHIFLFPSNVESLMFFCVNVIVVSTTIYALVFKYSNMKYLSFEQRKILQNLDEAHTYLGQIEEYSAQMGQIRHELKNHVFYIEDLLHQQDYETLLQYLETLKEHGLKGMEVVASGHPVVDALLNQKMAYAKSLGIQTQIHVALPDSLYIDNLTLCSLLGNLINNAVEACSGQASPFLSISMKPYKDYVTMEIQNSIEHNILKENPRLLSTKEDAKHHGIGLKVVQKLTEQYQGTIQMECKNASVFSVSLMLRNTPGSGCPSPGDGTPAGRREGTRARSEAGSGHLG